MIDVGGVASPPAGGVDWLTLIAIRRDRHPSAAAAGSRSVEGPLGAFHRATLRISRCGGAEFVARIGPRAPRQPCPVAGPGQAPVEGREEPTSDRGPGPRRHGASNCAARGHVGAAGLGDLPPGPVAWPPDAPADLFGGSAIVPRAVVFQVGLEAPLPLSMRARREPMPGQLVGNPCTSWVPQAIESSVRTEETHRNRQG